MTLCPHMADDTCPREGRGLPCFKNRSCLQTAPFQMLWLAARGAYEAVSPSALSGMASHVIGYPSGRTNTLLMQQDILTWKYNNGCAEDTGTCGGTPRRRRLPVQNPNVLTGTISKAQPCSHLISLTGSHCIHPFCVCCVGAKCC